MIRLETQRLNIRNFAHEDWESLQDIVLDFQASPYAIYDHPWPISDVEIQGICNWFSQGDEFLAVGLRETSELIGYLALNGTNNDGEINLGYCFNSGFHGNGYATEACKAALDYAFLVRNTAKITSGTAAANKPSCKLLEKLGLRKTGEALASFSRTHEGEPIEFIGYTFELTREEWLAKSN